MALKLATVCCAVLWFSSSFCFKGSVNGCVPASINHLNAFLPDQKELSMCRERQASDFSSTLWPQNALKNSFSPTSVRGVVIQLLGVAKMASSVVQVRFKVSFFDWLDGGHWICGVSGWNNETEPGEQQARSQRCSQFYETNNRLSCFPVAAVCLAQNSKAIRMHSLLSRWCVSKLLINLFAETNSLFPRRLIQTVRINRLLVRWDSHTHRPYLFSIAASNRSRFFCRTHEVSE
jgi:hypothetical protein